MTLSYFPKKVKLLEIGQLGAGFCLCKKALSSIKKATLEKVFPIVTL